MTPTDRQLLRKAHDRLRKPRNYLSALDEVRRDLPSHLYADLVQWLQADKQGAQFHRQMVAPKNLKVLSAAWMQTPLSARREIAWTAAILASTHQLLSEYVLLRERTEAALLRGDFADAEAALAIALERCGYSHWLIGTWTTLKQLSQGLEAQKTFAEAIRAGSAPNGITAYVTFYVSVRNEDAVTPSRFIETFVAQTHNIVDIGLRTYLRHRVVPTTIASADDLVNALRFDASASAIDAYETFLRIGRLDQVVGSSVSAEISSTIRRLDDITDSRLANLGTLRGERRSARHAKADSDPLLPFLRGDIAACAESADDYLRSSPRDAGAIELLSRAKSQRNPVSLSDDADPLLSAVHRTVSEDGATVSPLTLLASTIERLTAVFARSGDMERAVAELTRTGLNFAGSCWAEIVAAHALETPGDREYLASPAMQVALLASDRFMPQFLTTLSASPFFMQYIVAAVTSPPSAEVATFVQVLTSNATTLDAVTADERLMRGPLWDSIALQIALRSPDQRIAEALAVRLADSEDPRTSQFALRSLVRLRLASQDLSSACGLLIDACLRDARNAAVVPLEEVALRLADEQSALPGSPEKMIVLDLAVRRLGSVFVAARRFALDEYVSARGYLKPVPAVLDDKGLPESWRLYVLRNLCVPDIMDAVIGIDSSDDLEQQRILACQYLASSDPANAERYSEEVAERVGTLALRHRRKEIDASKIYVDTDGLLRIARDQLNEEFARYAALRSRSGGVGTVRELEDAFIRLTASDAETVRQGIQQLSVPGNEAAALFVDLFTRMRDLFAANSEYGLDGYLSTRVRHGILAAELRRPLESARLITLRDRATGEYRRNIAWVGQAEDAPHALQLSTALEQFARRFDALVDDISANWIQIRRTQEQRGDISLVVSAESIAVAEGLLPVDAAFEDFFGHCIGHLLIVLEQSLDKVRMRLREVACANALQLLDDLDASVRRTGNPSEVTAVHHAIQEARPEIHRAFERVSEWFRLPAEAVPEPITVNGGIGVAIAIAKTLYPSLVVEVQASEVGERMIPGQLLPGYFDVILIALENVVRHAGTNPPVAHITIAESADRLCVRVANMVAPVAVTDEARQRLETIRSAMRDARYLTSVHKERGTGFHKINRTIAHHFVIDPQLEFGFVTDARFEVAFCLPLTLPGKSR